MGVAIYDDEIEEARGGRADMGSESEPDSVLEDLTRYPHALE